MTAAPETVNSWDPSDWRALRATQQPAYRDPALLAEVTARLGTAAPVVAITECAALRTAAGQVAAGRGFILQGGDCAETLGQDPTPAVTALAGLFDRLVSVLGGRVVSIGRIAGQFAKPRSSATETRGVVTLTAYRGDSINGNEFRESARAPDPLRMIAAHAQSVETAEILRRARSGKAPIFTSHEALLLPYEQSLVRRDPDGGWWATSGQMLWVGDRSRQVDGAHIRFLSGVRNLVGVKCGPTLGPDELLRLLDRLDPANRSGKVALIGQFGAHSISQNLPPLMRAARREGRQVLWMTDPMHGNSRIEGARKVRRFDDILAETRDFFAIAAAEGVHPAGLHLEMSPDDVTECIGASGPENAEGMAIKFQSLCDPRLNAAQAEQLVRMVASLAPRNRMTALTARPGNALSGKAAIPGDKSCSHRALILAAMADGESQITYLGEAEDVMRTLAAITALGAEAEGVGEGRWRVRGARWGTPEAPIDCGNSGTTARLLIGAVAGMEGVSATFTGDASLSTRPMRRVVAPLQRMGARIEGGDTLPLTVDGATLGGIEFSNVPASAQVKSAILLAGLSGLAPVRIVEPMPSRDHSEIMLGQFGCPLVVADGGVELGAERGLTACDLTIGADPSAAAYALTAAAIVPGSSVTVEAMLVNPLRTGLYEVLEEMGAEVELANERIVSGEIIADVTVAWGRLQGITVTADRIPAMIDEIPALAMAAALADGETLIEGLGELRVKESDRLGAILAGLVACEVTALADGDNLRILGRGKARGGAVLSHGDHRIAMAFLTLGLAADGPVTLDDGAMIATSFPDFVTSMRALGADIA